MFEIEKTQVLLNDTGFYNNFPLLLSKPLLFKLHFVVCRKKDGREEGEYNTYSGKGHHIA